MNYDKVVNEDYIYQQYLPRLQHIWHCVAQANEFLKLQKVKSRIYHGFFDCINHSLLYGPKNTDRVLIACHKIKDMSLINAPYFPVSHKIYGIHYMPKYSWHRDIDKDFNCFLNRLDPVRQDFFYQLYQHGLIDSSLVSFNMTVRKDLYSQHISGQELFDEIHHKFLSSWDHIKPQLDKIVPFRNFEENKNLSILMMRCKFSIVVETYFERTDAITFSEKTWRAIQTPRPWLLFHATGSVQLLRDMGFYVYDDFVDHSYDQFDTSTHYIERMNAIFMESQRLMKEPVSTALLSHWEQQTMNNLRIFKDWADDKTDVFETIDIAKQCALNLS